MDQDELLGARVRRLRVERWLMCARRLGTAFMNTDKKNVSGVYVLFPLQFWNKWVWVLDVGGHVPLSHTVFKAPLKGRIIWSVYVYIHAHTYIHIYIYLSMVLKLTQ